MRSLHVTPFAAMLMLLSLMATSAAASLVATPLRQADGTPGHFPFPHYMQCDPRWGKDTMGIVGPGERSTICGEGCAMTSTTMALAGLGVVSPNNASHLVNPGELNAWLIDNRGYLCAGGDCNNLNLTAPERFSPRLSLIGENEKPSYQAIVASIKAGTIIHVAHVRNNSHFVLLVWPGEEHDTFYVHDPYYPVDAYPYANISDIIAYHVDQYPVYKQCDPAWANNVMGTNGQTICDVGCLMSSISMAIHGHHIPIGNVSSDPATLNAWLRAHSGYTPGSALYESKIPEIAPAFIQWPADGMHTSNDISWFNVTKYLDAYRPRVLIANVMHGQHFVLVVGYRSDGDTLVVNDPGFDRNTYSYKNDVVGWRVFDMEDYHA